MIIFDFEIFKYDWLVVWADSETGKIYNIVNNVDKLRGFYKHYKDKIMVGYNSNHYDVPIMQSILSGFNPYELSDCIINQDKPAWQFSRLLSRFPVISYDCMVKDKSLKQLECSLGLKIKESSISFDIDRKLTTDEIKETLEYCTHDVKCTMEVFLTDGFAMSPQDDYKSSIGIIEEFKFPMTHLSKTKAQLGCQVLGAVKKKFYDEFDISTPDFPLGKYEYVREWFLNPENHWYSKTVDGRKQPIKNEFVTNIAGVEHVFAWGGVHASVPKGIYEGTLLMCDFASLYPNIMIEYNLISRGVPNPEKYKHLLETRLELKRQKISREKSYKIVLNGSYGQMKFANSPLYDPRNANNVCVYGQIIALYLVSKLEQVSEILNTNTDGVLVRVNSEENKRRVEAICAEVADEVRIGLEIEEYSRFIVKDVNNYIAVKPNGKFKAKGSYVKVLNPLERSLDIVNKAIRNYYINGIPVETTVMESNDILDFQIIAKAGRKYNYAMHGDVRIPEKVNRVFASKNENDAGLFKVHKNGGVAKVEMTPEHCLIINEDVREMNVPNEVDRHWYIKLANRRVKEFIGG